MSSLKLYTNSLSSARVVNQAEYKKAKNKRENNVRVGLDVGFAVGGLVGSLKANNAESFQVTQII